jgi:hypothetical protein
MGRYMFEVARNEADYLPEMAPETESAVCGQDQFTGYSTRRSSRVTRLAMRAYGRWAEIVAAWRRKRR